VIGDEPCVTNDQVGHLVAAIQEHAKGSHGHDLTREHVLAEIGVTLADAG
jgi:hypothetical protein